MPASRPRSQPAPQVADVLAALTRSGRALLNSGFDGGFPLAWRRAPTPPKDPLRARIDPRWPLWTAADSTQLRKRRPNWFYAEVEFPRRLQGVDLAGTEAWIFIWGYAPFTLWIDGVEMYRESRAWHATGGIADPLPLPLVPGARHRLVVRVIPTELPNTTALLDIRMQSRACYDLGLELSTAAAQLRLAEALASDEAERALVARAAACVDPADLARERWPRVLPALPRLEAALAPLSAKAKATTVHLVGHSHIDMDWMWTWDDTVHCIRRDFKAVTDIQDDHAEVTFLNSQVPTYQVAQEHDPAVYAKIRTRIDEGRWEVAAANWVEGDLAMADGESFARHALYAGEWCERELGRRSRVLWAPDNFSHPGNMPQLARLAGCEAYFHMRCPPAGPDGDAPPVARLWEGIDGTPILALSTGYTSTLNPLGIGEAALGARRLGLDDALHVWGIGDHGGGLARFWLDYLARFRNRPLMPSIRHSTIAEVARRLRSREAQLPRNRGETYQLFEGCFTTHARLKRRNRDNESALRTAESLSALAGTDARARLREAWTGTLFNQFHDILCGASVPDAYRDAERRADTADRAAKQAATAALKTLVRGHAARLTVINQLGHARTEPTRARVAATALIDASGRRLPAQRLDGETVFIARDLPAWAATEYRVAKAGHGEFASVAVADEGAYLRIETTQAIVRLHQASGVIGSWFDKRLGRELVAYGTPRVQSHGSSTRRDLALNVLHLIDESPLHNQSAWLINDPLRDEALLRGAKTTLIESGPVFARLRVEHRVRASRIVQELTFWNELPRVDVRMRVDWRERGSAEAGVPQLKVAFTAALSAARLRTEGPFTVVERPADGQERPTQRWLDLQGDEGGFALLNRGQYGCDALGSRARLTLLRGAYAPDPASDLGRHEIDYAFVPHAADLPSAELVRWGMSYNQPPLALRGAARMPEQVGLQLVGSDSVVVTCVRRAERSDRLLVRLLETSGQAADITLGFGRPIMFADAVDFHEDAFGEQPRLAAGCVETRLRGFEVKTLAVMLG